MKKAHLLIKKVYFLLFYALCFAPISSIAADFSRACKPLNAFMADGSGDNFLLKEAFITISEACSSVAQLSWDAFAISLQGVVAIGTGIYIAIYTLRNVGSFSQQDVAAYLSGDKGGIIPLCVRLAIITYLLGHEDVIYKYLICPVVIGGIEVGGLISSASLGFTFLGARSVEGLFAQVIIMAQNFNDQIYLIVAMGRMLLCLAFLPDLMFDWYISLVPFGATFYVFGWFILIAISFYLLDVLFRLGVACILLPMAIACAISKLTISYTKSTWNFFINVAFNFMILGVIIKFTTEMLSKSATGGSEGLKERLGGSGGNLVLNKEDVESLVEVLDINAFILVSICCMISFKLFSNVETLTDKLSNSTSVGKSAQQMGGEVLNKGKNIAQKSITEGKKMVGTTIDEAKDSLADTGMARTAVQMKDNLKNSAKLAVGLDDQANRDLLGDKIKNTVKDVLDL